MAVATYDTIINDVQTRLYNIISADTNSVTLTSEAGESISTTLADLTVVDGIPKALLKGTGYPYIIIHTGEITEEPFTITRRMKMSITTTIELVDRRESNVRKLGDLIRKVIHDNAATSNFIGGWIVNRSTPRSNMVIRTLETNDVEYTYQLFVRHEFYGG